MQCACDLGHVPCLFPPPLHLSYFISLPPLCVFFLMYPSVGSTRGAWVLIEALTTLSFSLRAGDLSVIFPSSQDSHVRLCGMCIAHGHCMWRILFTP